MRPEMVRFVDKLRLDGFTVEVDEPTETIRITSTQFHSGGAASVTVDSEFRIHGLIALPDFVSENGTVRPELDSVAGFLNWLFCAWCTAHAKPAPKL